MLGIHDELEELAKAVQRKNRADAEIARIIGRPALIGHTGEYIAAIIFNIKLRRSAASKGIDGCFVGGDLAKKTVNIKWYSKMEGVLDITPEAIPDFYLVMAGPRGAATSSRGTTRPWLISHVFLFDGRELITELESLGVKIGIATSVRKYLWEMAEIYPTQRNNQLVVSEEQRRLLSLFGKSSD